MCEMSRFDLTLELTVQEGGSLVLGHMEYSKDLVQEETAIRMVTMFQVLPSPSVLPAKQP